MRAADILLFCLCLNAAIAMIDASGMGAMFTGVSNSQTGFLTPQKGGVFANTLGDLSKSTSSGGTLTPYDMFAVGAAWIVETTLFMISFLLSAIFVIPALMRIFFFPVWLAVFVQALLYVTYMWAYVQWKSGKSLFSYQ
jgi:hypothetical protein